MTAMLSTLGLVLIVWLGMAAATAAFVSASGGFLLSRTKSWHGIDRARIDLMAATAPVVFPTLLVFFLLAPGFLGLVAPAVDHCPLHPDHPHLCLAHPTAALPPIVASVLLTTCIIGASALACSIYRRSRLARPLRELDAKTRDDLSPGVELLESDRVLALTFGWVRPRTLISTGLLRSLRAQQIDIVVAHEREHVRRRDPLRLFVARLCSVPLWPSVRRALLDDLALGAEQACDQRAADSCRDRLAVAETILLVERLLDANFRSARLGSAGIADISISERVQTLLGESTPRDRSWLVVAIGIPIGMAATTRPLHHELEHLLALVFGAR